MKGTEARRGCQLLHHSMGKFFVSRWHISTIFDDRSILEAVSECLKGFFCESRYSYQLPRDTVDIE